MEHMRSITEYMQDLKYESIVFNETLSIISEGMITESFKAEMLTNLAKEISKAEKEHNKREIENSERITKEYGYKHTPNVKSFSTIFGPVTVTSRYGGKSKKTSGVKWSDVTDSDFMLFPDPEDKQLKKFIKDCYANRKNALMILCEHGTKKICYVVQAYKENADKVCYEFVDNGWNKGVQAKTARAYKYSSRNLKAEEVLDLIASQALDTYALEITKDMTQAYNEIVKNREDSREGMINYDKNSLSQMLAQQQARYKTLVKEIKAKKLMEDPNMMYDEIIKLQEEATALLKEIINKPENIDKFYNAADIMRTISYCFEEFYKYAREQREGEKMVQKYIGRGKEEEEARKYAKEWHNGESHILDAKKYLKEIKEQIEQMRKQMNAPTEEYDD